MTCRSRVAGALALAALLAAQPGLPVRADNAIRTAPDGSLHYEPPVQPTARTPGAPPPGATDQLLPPPPPAPVAGAAPEVPTAVTSGMSGLAPVFSFPPNCMPILGMPETGMNPLLTNVQNGAARIAVLAEQTGFAATVGRSWADGIQLAANIVNENGGMLGRPIEVRVFDTRSDVTATREAVGAAIAYNPFVILGPGIAATSAVAIEVLRRSQIPVFVGTRGLDLMSRENPYLFRTGTTALEEYVELVVYLRDQMKARNIAIVSSDNDAGADARQQLRATLDFLGMRLVEDVKFPVGAPDFARQVFRLKARSPDALILLGTEHDLGRLVAELRQEGLDAPVFIEGTALGPDFLRLAGTAATGVMGWVGPFAGAPVMRIREMAQRFRAVFHYEPAPSAVQGFMALNVVKAIADQACSINAPDLLRTARSNFQVEAKTAPGVLMDFSYGPLNNLIRDNFLFELRGGEPRILAVLPLSGKLF